MEEPYYCIELSIAGEAHWWNLDNGRNMWTSHIHNAQKFDTKEKAEKAQKEHRVPGKVTEHMDMYIPDVI